MNKQGTAAKKDDAGVLEGVNLGKVNEMVLRAFLAEHTGENTVEKCETVAELVAVGNRHFTTCYGKPGPGNEKLVQCDACNAWSSEDLDACPFCGESDGTTINPENFPASAKIDEPAKATSVKTTANKKPKGDKPAKTDKPPKGKDTALAVVDKEVVHVAELVPATNTSTESDLDGMVDRVHKLKGAGALAAWHLGAALNETTKLWKLRLDENGKPKYKGFDGFCHHELGMTPPNAYKLMDIAKNYNAEQVLAWGPSKLGLVLQAPPDLRPQLLERVDGGASKAEIEAAVRGAKAETGFQRPRRDTGTSGSTSNEAAGRAPKTPREEKVTVASLVGRVTIKMYAKPASKKDVLTDGKRARQMTDIPTAIETMENGIVVTYTVTKNPNGEINLVIDRKREKE